MSLNSSKEGFNKKEIRRRNSTHSWNQWIAARSASSASSASRGWICPLYCLFTHPCAVWGNFRVSTANLGFICSTASTSGHGYSCKPNVNLELTAMSGQPAFCPRAGKHEMWAGHCFSDWSLTKGSGVKIKGLDQMVPTSHLQVSCLSRNSARHDSHDTATASQLPLKKLCYAWITWHNLRKLVASQEILLRMTHMTHTSQVVLLSLTANRALWSVA